MDEAERCHRLAILAEGRLVAEGVPRDLMRDIAAAVVEVEAEDVTAARRALAGDERVRSMAQLGTRLHALLDRDTPDPRDRVAARLADAGVTARVRSVAASLEDVFVAATGFRDEGVPRGTRH
jgi:ABC-2 type transport system ATP-binding protein